MRKYIRAVLILRLVILLFDQCRYSINKDMYNSDKLKQLFVTSTRFYPVNNDWLLIWDHTYLRLWNLGNLVLEIVCNMQAHYA